MQMRALTGMFAISGQAHWQIFQSDDFDGEDGVAINFHFTSKMKKRDLTKVIQAGLEANNIDWLVLKRDQWILRTKKLRDEFEHLHDLAWLTDDVVIEPEIEIETEDVFGRTRDTTLVSFVVTKEYMTLTGANRIFLSHKGVDKPFVRDFKTTLEALGFKPWFDEDAMSAGTELERGILQGFKSSCAAVFFITPSFKDESFIASEVNYAISEKREKQERFSIITLVFKDEHGRAGQVPDLLKPYVWKEPSSQLEALRELLRALPLEVGSFNWKY